ncbi:hypothetical protein V2J09_022507 [Rumex salicifolius]
MEVDWFENFDTAEEMLQVDADNDASMFEDDCIDDWSTITNLCPLCHNEFQLITCVPVIDTIGGNTTDEDSISRNNDWSVEGKNSTLSFPSYYIDENSVTCLDGDGCKLRSDSVTLDENLAFDTSIACDSCDTCEDLEIYYAEAWVARFVLLFLSCDPGNWLLKRKCLVDEACKLDASTTELARDQYHSGVAGSQCSADTFSGKVSISVADDGETAMVVSLVDQKHLIEELTQKPLTTNCPEFDKINQSRWDTPETSSNNTSALSRQNITNELSNPKEGGIKKPVSTDMALGSAHSNHNLKSNLKDYATFNQHNSLIDCPQSIIKRTSEDDATQRPDEGMVVAGCAADRSNAEAGVPMLAGEKRRRTGLSTNAHVIDRKRARLATQGLSREIKLEKNGERASKIGLSESGVVNKFQEVGNDIRSSRNESVGLQSTEEETTLDIMSIVQGTESNFLCSNGANKVSKRRDAAKPRVKKIIRRPVEDKESSSIVQNLRKEIREAIGHKSSEDIGKNIVDHKLLAAFRAAVAVPGAEPIKKVSASVVKPNRMMLQKGKTRENLTKKIYATASGKRRNAWYRDCQVEFWKHRCPKTTEHEKIETLQSVLSLLKYDPDAKQAEKNPKEGSNSILSRLYLADASVFPRKDNVKPLAALETFSAHLYTSTEETKAHKIDSSLSSPPLKNNSSCLDTKKSKSTSSSMKKGDVSGKGKIDKVEDIKTDKRKWALQILARKTASNSTGPGHQKQEENSVLKGNYPLLAQMPIDMRPKMEPCRHNKIPNSVRQAQLYHLAENLLKLTNISPIRKTAATELAIADAVNIEREIASRSNSKVVYINLCSQELRRHKSTYSQSAVEDPNPSIVLPVSTEGEPSSSSPSLDPEVEEALKNAGLLADSPPSDTYHRTANFNDVDDSDECDEAQGKGPENVLEMDLHPDLDIYGEFEYDIEDEDYIGASAIKDPKLQTEEGESKMKLVFSTLSTDNKQEETARSSENLERPTDEQAISVSQSDEGKLIKIETEESSSLPPDSTTEGVEDPTPTDCEELYGPEKEPMFNTYPFNDHTLAPGTKSSDVEGGKQDPSISDVIRSAQTNESESNPRVKVDKQQLEINDSVTKKVESYIKEHIRPLCKSGVITVEQYRWAVGKTTDKVMKYHSKAKNANFLIKEGEKVKKLAEQYVEGAKFKDKDK